MACVCVGSASIAHCQVLDVKIVDRQNSDTDYSYQVGGRSTSTTNGSASCYGSNTINCDVSSTTSTHSTAPQLISYHVSGATFSLILPDGRVAVVNCVSKFQERFAGRGNHRSCRMPIVDDIQAEFKGKNAKLAWPVSIDGKKMESETYTILGVLPKP